MNMSLVFQAISFFWMILMLANCQNLGILGQGGVSGSVAKKEIKDAVETNSNLYWLDAQSDANKLLAASGSKVSLSFFDIYPSILLTTRVDGVVVPGLAGISDSKHYSRASVDACVDNIKNFGVIIPYGNVNIGSSAINAGSASAPSPSPSMVGALQCDLKTTPSILQIGDGEKGSLIQLGPIGL